MNDEKTSIVSYNIALKKSNLSAALAQIDKLKGVLVNHTKQPTPIVTQFPDMLLLAEPKSQITVLIQNEIVVVSDSSTEIDQTKATLLAAIASELNDKITEPLANYALNFAYIFTYDSANSVETLSRFLNLREMHTSTLVGSASGPSFGSFAINERSEDEYKRVIVSARLDKDNQLTNVVDFQRSIQSTTSALPAISNLATKLLEEDRVSRELRGKLINDTEETNATATDQPTDTATRAEAADSSGD